MITDYGSLQSAVATWLARTDLTANIPDFITVFESAANRRLRVSQMETGISFTTVAGSFNLPVDYLGWREVIWTAGGFNSVLAYVPPTYIDSVFTTPEQGTPVWFTIEDGVIFTAPQDDSTNAFGLTYFAKVPSLSDSNTTNWLLTAHPDAYLFGALVEANTFIKDPDTAILWKARRDEVLQEIITLDTDSIKEHGAIRVVGWVP